MGRDRFVLAVSSLHSTVARSLDLQQHQRRAEEDGAINLHLRIDKQKLISVNVSLHCLHAHQLTSPAKSISTHQKVSTSTSELSNTHGALYVVQILTDKNNEK